MMVIQSLVNTLKVIPEVSLYGYVKGIVGMVLEVSVPPANVVIGQQVLIMRQGLDPLVGEVVGFRNDVVIVMPFGDIVGIHLADNVHFLSQSFEIHPAKTWLGRVVNGFGNPIDGKGALDKGEQKYLLKPPTVSGKLRNKTGERIDVGVKSINTFLTCCQGQRMGIFAGSGVGKSMLMGMLAKFTACDVAVIGLIGERGREVREFIDDVLGEEGLKKSIVVVSTSEEPPLVRRQAAYLTLALAEYFRDQQKSVLCLFDSVTRFAMAQREIGLATGEPPTTKGYTPSVFYELARLLERAGPNFEELEGDITAFFTVLVDGDDHNEPIADAVRGILDGHIVLDRKLADRGHFPAINVLRSISRTVPRCHQGNENQKVREALRYISIFEDVEDLVRLGAYKEGTDPETDRAIQLNPLFSNFLQQGYEDNVSLPNSFSILSEIIS